MPLLGFVKVPEGGTKEYPSAFTAIRNALKEFSDETARLSRAIADLRAQKQEQSVVVAAIPESDFPSFVRTTYTSQSVSYNILATDHIIYGTTGAGGITLTLPATIVVGQQYIVQKVDSGAGVLTIARNGNNINGTAADKTIATQWNGALIVGQSATNWSAMDLPALP